MLSNEIKEKILSESCTKKCIWKDNMEPCHSLFVADDLFPDKEVMMTTDDILFLSKLKIYNLDLSTLELSGNHLVILSQAKNIYSLDLSHSNIDDAYVKIIAKNQYIRKLNLAYNQIRARGVYYLIQNNNYHTVNLTYNKSYLNSVQEYLERFRIPNLVVKDHSLCGEEFRRLSLLKYNQYKQKIMKKLPFIKDISFIIVSYVM